MRNPLQVNPAARREHERAVALEIRNARLRGEPPLPREPAREPDDAAVTPPGPVVDVERAAVLRSFGVSPRQLEVLALVACGLSSPQAAAALHVSVDTVKTHLRRTSAALGASTRTHAVMLALRAGVLVRADLPARLPVFDRPLTQAHRVTLQALADGHGSRAASVVAGCAPLTVHSRLQQIGERCALNAGQRDRTLLVVAAWAAGVVV